uniref:Uncharacterized protein n=1 Tax=viral metagenome TaxID=1070528 RepID=A0A6C0C7Q0_9ZZZZ
MDTLEQINNNYRLDAGAAFAAMIFFCPGERYCISKYRWVTAIFMSGFVGGIANVFVPLQYQIVNSALPMLACLYRWKFCDT